MYNVSIYDSQGRLKHQSYLQAMQLAQFVMQTNVGGLEYDGADVQIRIADAHEPALHLHQIERWIESYLNLNLAGCC